MAQLWPSALCTLLETLPRDPLSPRPLIRRCPLPHLDNPRDLRFQAWFERSENARAHVREAGRRLQAGNRLAHHKALMNEVQYGIVTGKKARSKYVAPQVPVNRERHAVWGGAREWRCPVQTKARRKKKLVDSGRVPFRVMLKIPLDISYVTGESSLSAFCIQMLGTIRRRSSDVQYLLQPASPPVT